MTTIIVTVEMATGTATFTVKGHDLTEAQATSQAWHKLVNDPAWAGVKDQLAHATVTTETK